MADENTLKRINEILLQGIYATGIDADPSANNYATDYPTEHGDLIRELEKNGTLDELQDLVGGEKELENLITDIVNKQVEVSPRYLESTPPLNEYGEEFGARGAYGITTEELLQPEIQDVIKQNLGIDTPTNVVDDIDKLNQELNTKYADVIDNDYGLNFELRDGRLHITDMYLKDAERGKGIGSEIFDEIKQFADNNNLEISLYNDGDFNTTFWENKGFQEWSSKNNVDFANMPDDKLGLFILDADTPTNVVDVGNVHDNPNYKVSLNVDNNGNVIIYRSTNTPDRFSDTDFSKFEINKTIGEQTYFASNPEFAQSFSQSGKRNIYSFSTNIKPEEILHLQSNIYKNKELLNKLGGQEYINNIINERGINNYRFDSLDNIPKNLTWAELYYSTNKGRTNGSKEILQREIVKLQNSGVKAIGVSPVSGAKNEYNILPIVNEQSQLDIVAKGLIDKNLKETSLDTPTNVVDDANVYYHSRIENLSDASDTHFGTYNAALDRASLQYGKENIKNFYTRALRDAYDELVNELDGLEYVIEDGEYTLPEKQIQFGFEHFNQAVPPKSQDIQFLIELDGYQGINLYVLDDGYPVEIERFDAGGLLYDAEEGSIETFRNTDAEYVFGRKEDFALQSEYVSRMQDGVPLDVYSGDFDVDSKYNLYEMKVKPNAKLFDISGKEIEIVNTFRKQGETTYNTKSTVVSSEFLQYELFAENAPGLGKVSEIKIDGVSYKPKSEVFQNKEEIIQVLSGDADVIIYTNEIEDAGSSSLYVRNADAVDVSLVDEERLNVFNEDVNTKYYQTSPLDEDLLRKLSQGKITQEQYDKYKQPYTDTPTNVVDDGPALLETRIENKAKTDRTTTLIPEWKFDVVKPNKIFAPSKMETNRNYIAQGQKFPSGEDVLNAIKAGTATDEDITRFFIYLASKSPHKVYAYKPMSNADAVADIAKIGIFSERPLDELLPLTNKDPELTAKYNLVLDNDYVLRDLDRKIILDLINEQGQFNNLKERMRNTLIDAHNKIYAPNPNDYFFLWRGGGLSRFNTWQSFSKSMESASGVMYQLKSTGIVPLEGGVNTYVINKNNMIDLDSLGLSHGNEREIIVLTEAANKTGAKLPKDKVYDTGLDNPQQLKNYIDNWALRAREPEFFPKNGFVIENISTQLNELGQSTQNFFNDLISGMTPDLRPNKPYEQIIELNNPQLQNAQDIYNKYVAQGGDFNPHYFTSIPTIYETQIVKAQALNNMLDKHDKVINDTGTIKVLDIGGTEGVWGNTVAEIGGEKVYVEIIEPSPTANKLYNEINTPVNSRFRNEAFSYVIEDQGKFFNEPNSVRFSEFFAGGTKDSTTGLRNPDVQVQGGKYDVVHEAMAFQFVDKNRQAQIDFIAKNVLADDGILFIEEKFKNVDAIYNNNEKLKDDFKSTYYTDEQINSKYQNIVGPMGDKQVSVQEIENILGNRFKYVNQYWDSGNFKGYIASNNPLSETFVDEIHALDTSLTNHRFSTAPTQEELKYAVQKDMRNRGIDLELAKDFAKRFVESNKDFVQKTSDALGEVYKGAKAVGPAAGALGLRGLAKVAPVLAPGDVLVEGALGKVTPYIDDFAKRLGFASLPVKQVLPTYIAADIGAAGAELVSAAMYAYDESQRKAPQQPSQFQESLTRFLLPKEYEEEAVQKLQIPQDLQSFYKTPAGEKFLEDNDFGSLFKKQLEQEKLTKYSPGWQLSKAIFSLFGSMGSENSSSEPVYSFDQATEKIGQ